LDCAIATDVTGRKLCKRLVFQLKLLLPWDCSIKVDEGLENEKFASSNMASREM
jgi:hypothetical protein